MLPLGFHSVGELGIKEVDTNPARSRFEDYRSPRTLCQLVYGCMISLEKERIALSIYLGSEGLDQRCNDNLIIRSILSRIILL